MKLKVYSSNLQGETDLMINHDTAYGSVVYDFTLEIAGCGGIALSKDNAKELVKFILDKL